MSKKKLKVLDLFSGIGGFSLGLERTGGFETVAFCEQDKHCHEVLNKHWPDVAIFKDVVKLDAESLAQVKAIYEAELRSSFSMSAPPRFKNIDVITGGFPCQDISFAGARKGISAERSGLWKHYLRLIKELEPKYAIIENVEYLRKNGLGVVLNDLARVGYDAEWSCITADSLGYPHQRKRLFIVSYPRRKRLNQRIGKKRHVQVNEKWTHKTLDSDGQQCKSQPIEVCPIFSQGSFESFQGTQANKRAAVSRVRRVTNGVPEGLDESKRKQRIKQLGNSIVPDAATWIGQCILERESQVEL